MSNETSTNEKKGMTPIAVGLNVTPVQTLRRNSSLRPKRSLLKIQSLRPMKPLIGKLSESENLENKEETV